MSFVVKTLAEVLEVIVDNRGRTCPTEQDGFPLIATNCIKEDHLFPVHENIRHVSEETRQTWFRGHPEPGDIVFVCKGSPGRVAIVPDPVSFCIAQDMVALRVDETQAVSDYLYYLLQSPGVKRDIENMHVGTMIPHFKKGDFKHLRLRLHADMEDQRRIGRSLRALDDKIVANERQINILRDLFFAESVALWRGGGNPVPLGDVAAWTKGVSYKSSELSDHSPVGMVSLKSVGTNGSFQERGIKPFLGNVRKQQVLCAGEVVVACTDLTQDASVIGRAIRVPRIRSYTTLVASLDLSIVRPIRDWSTVVIFGLLAHPNFQQHCLQFTSGTTVLHLGQAAFDSYRFPGLADDQAHEFAARTAPLLGLLDRLRDENWELANLRNSLLPGLMDGTLAIRAAEDLVSDAV